MLGVHFQRENYRERVIVRTLDYIRTQSELSLVSDYIKGF